MSEWKKLLEPQIIWALIGLFLLIGEFIVPGMVISFFGAGALIVALVCVFADISLNVQLIIFIVSSIVLLVALRKWLKGVFLGHTDEKQQLSEDLQAFVGKTAFVKKKIEPGKRGKVEFNGADWTVEADGTEETIEEGAQVEIVNRLGLILKVKPK